MREIELLSQITESRDVAVGLVDVKSFHRESPELVAERLRIALRHAPADRVRIVPDCGFWAVPRWLAAVKLRSMVAGVALVRAELGAV